MNCPNSTKLILWDGSLGQTNSEVHHTKLSIMAHKEPNTKSKSDEKTEIEDDSATKMLETMKMVKKIKVKDKAAVIQDFNNLVPAEMMEEEKQKLV